MLCNLCPNMCNVNRAEKQGKCLTDDKAHVAKYGLHFWEEPVLTGKKGSGAVFFEGCTMRCAFCQNKKISRRTTSRGISDERLADIFRELDETAENINLVSPTPYVENIVNALKLYKPKHPVVYNTSGYENVDTVKKLDGFVNVYLPDLKYADDALSLSLSRTKNYLKYALSSIDAMCRQVGKPRFAADGTMTSGVIVRHLVLPSYIRNSLDVLKLFAENFKNRALISVMCQFTPTDVENMPRLNRTLKPIEYKRVLLELEKLNIADGFVQELSSASADYIPDF